MLCLYFRNCSESLGGTTAHRAVEATFNSPVPHPPLPWEAFVLVALLAAARHSANQGLHPQAITVLASSPLGTYTYRFRTPGKTTVHFLLFLLMVRLSLMMLTNFKFVVNVYHVYLVFLFHFISVSLQ